MKESAKMKHAIVGLIEKGLSLTRAANALGIHHSTAGRWRTKDEDFATRIEQAESKFILSMTEHIAEAAKTDWRAGVELLARRFPREYAKPETQTAITVNAGPPRQSIEELAKDPSFVDALGKLQERIRIRQAMARAKEAKVVSLPGKPGA